mgnify:CR=1 FL=1
MELLLRLNLARENKWVRDTGIDFSTIVLSANVLETFFQTSVSTINALKKPYVIDPLTHIFAIQSVDLSPKRWYSKLVAHYGLDLIIPDDAAFLSIDQMLSSHRPTKELKNFVENVVEYERGRIVDSKEYDEIVEVEEFEGRPVDERLFRPRLLIPPYFYVGYDVEDIDNVSSSEWLRINIECIKHAITLKSKNEKIYPVVLIEKTLLYFPNEIKSIVNAYNIDGADGFFIWVADFREHSESESLLKGLRSLTKLLADLHKPVYNLYGGFFSILLRKEGMAGISHSICYGEYKNPFAEPGMLATIRFYDQELRSKVPYGKMDEMLRMTKRQWCNCDYCRTLRSIRGNEKESRGKRIEYAAKHFLLKRSGEMAAIDSPEDIMKQLNRSYDLHKNSDTEGVYSDFYRHLDLWKDALKSGAR